jgi:hypothetical protein
MLFNQNDQYREKKIFLKKIGDMPVGAEEGNKALERRFEFFRSD